MQKRSNDQLTAYELWTALKPTEAYTEEEIHRALGRVRIETCSNDMELVERMYDVVNKAQYAVPEKRKQHEIQAVQAATLNLKQQTHKLRFLHLLTYMRQQDTPQTVKVFEDEFIKILNEEKEVEQHNQHNKTSRQAAYNATTRRRGQGQAQANMHLLQQERTYREHMLQKAT